MPQRTKNADHQQYMSTFQQLKMPKHPYPKYPSKTLLKSDSRYTFEDSNNSIDEKIKGLLHSNAFAFVNKKNISPKANVLRGRLTISIKQVVTENESCNFHDIRPSILKCHAQKW